MNLPTLSSRNLSLPLLFIAGLMMSCSKPTPIQSGPKVVIAIGGQAQLVYLPVTLAEQLGYYRAEGLEVELHDFPGGSKALEALMGGSTDVVSGFFDHTVQMAAEGKPIRSFVAMLRYPGLALVVSPKSSKRVETVRDLAGLNVGVSAPGSSTHMMLNHLLIKHGLKPGDASAIGIGMAAGAVAAMEAGKVDAAIMAEPAISQLRARDANLRVLAHTQSLSGVRDVYGVSSYPAAVLYSHSAWVEKNQILAQRLAKAIRRTLAWIQAHSAADIAAKMPPQLRGENLELYTQAIANSKDMFSPDGVLDDEGAQAVVRVLSESLEKVRVARPDVKQCYTNQFVY
jgi:NitT/TauT family transport system substrate-binding protein